mgnify:FL=1
MSGGAFGYQAFKLEDLESIITPSVKFVAALEHEVDWAVNGDDCTQRRVWNALISFFYFLEDRDEKDFEQAMQRLTNREDKNFMCERDRVRKNAREMANLDALQQEREKGNHPL